MGGEHVVAKEDIEFSPPLLPIPKGTKGLVIMETNTWVHVEFDGYERTKLVHREQVERATDAADNQ